MSRSELADLEALLEYLKNRSLKAWHAVLIADIIGERLARAEALKPKPPEPEVELPRTQVVDLSSVLVRGAYELLRVRGRGELVELVVVSPSKDFGLQVFMDGALRLSRSFEELESISPHAESIAAYRDAETGLCVLNVRDLRWASELSLTITAREPIEFKRVFATYKVYGR
jgi:hypothetical protein